MSSTEAPEVVQADPNETGVYEIESLCMNCRDNVCTHGPLTHLPIH